MVVDYDYGHIFSRNFTFERPIGHPCILAITKVDVRRTDALDQWCLRTMLRIKWHQFVRNDDVRRITNQPNLTTIIQSRRLSTSGHIARMYDDVDAKMILTLPTR